MQESQQVRDCLVAIPALNEARYLQTLLQDISAYFPVDHILVVNDGSTDETGSIARRAGVNIIEHSRNLGKGAAIRSALYFAQKYSFAWVLFLDGDGQHPVSFVPQFLQHIQTGHADLVLGNRHSRSQTMPLHRQLSNGITSIMVSLSAGGQRIYDSQCGFRAIRLKTLHGISLSENGFQLESELLIKIGRTRARIQHVPISTQYRGEHSSIHLVGDTLKFIKLFISSLWW